jgi:hypothetical protein
MKKLIIISGSVGVGKTTIAEKLFYSIANSAWLDPDQTWWSMKPNETPDCAIPYILDNTIHCINNYIRHELDPIIISWFFPKADQLVLIHRSIAEPTRLLHYMLIANRETLAIRHGLRGDMRPYEEWMILDGNQVLPNTVIIDTETIALEEIVKRIKDDVMEK